MKEIKEKSKPFHHSIGHDEMNNFPEIIYKDIIKEKPHEGLPNELYPTSLCDCPRKIVLLKWLDELGYEEIRKEKNKWYTYRGNVWDEYLSNLFEEHGGYSQVSLMVIVPIIGKDKKPEDVALIRGRIDAIYKENGEWKLIDFKTASESKMIKNEHIRDKYIAQISFYSRVMNIEEFGLFFVTNAAPAYEKFTDESGILRTFTYDKLVEKAYKIYEAYKKGYLPADKNTDSCRYCPFRDVCHRISSAADPKEALKREVEKILDGKTVKKKNS